MLIDNLFICATFLSIVRQTDFIVEPFMFFHGLLCSVTYKGKAAKTYCAVERDDCAAIKRLNNKCIDLCGFTMHCNRDCGNEKKHMPLIYTCSFRS